MKSSNSIRMVNIFFLVLALIFSYRSFGGIIDFETTVTDLIPTYNRIINVDDAFMTSGVLVKFGFGINVNADSHDVFEK